mgnify:FL=1
MRRSLLVIIFMIIGIQVYSLTPLPNNYMEKEDGIYYLDQKTQIDQKTFELLPSGRFEYAKDKNNVYYKGIKMPGADPATIEGMGLFAKDKNSVYYKGNQIKDADPSTIKVSGLYSKDKNNVYFEDIKIIGVDKETFEVFSYDYEAMIPQTGYAYFAKDSNNVYCGREIIESADLKTFKVTDYDDATDKNKSYKCVI